MSNRPEKLVHSKKGQKYWSWKRKLNEPVPQNRKTRLERLVEARSWRSFNARPRNQKS